MRSIFLSLLFTLMGCQGYERHTDSDLEALSVKDHKTEECPKKGAGRWELASGEERPPSVWIFVRAGKIVLADSFLTEELVVGEVVYKKSQQRVVGGTSVVCAQDKISVRSVLSQNGGRSNTRIDYMVKDEKLIRRSRTNNQEMITLEYQLVSKPQVNIEEFSFWPEP